MIPPVQIESNCFYTNILTARNEVNNCSRVAVQLLTMCLRALYIHDCAVQANYSTRATHEAQGFQSVWKAERKLCAVTRATHTSKASIYILYYWSSYSFIIRNDGVLLRSRGKGSGIINILSAGLNRTRRVV